MMKQHVLQLRNKREKGTSMQTSVMQSCLKTILPQESKHQPARLSCWTPSQATSFQTTKPMVQPACTFLMNLLCQLRLRNPFQVATPFPKTQKREHSCRERACGEHPKHYQCITSSLQTTFQHFHNQPDTKMGVLEHTVSKSDPEVPSSPPMEQPGTHRQEEKDAENLG